MGSRQPALGVPVEAEEELRGQLLKCYGWTGEDTKKIEVKFDANDFDCDQTIQIGPLIVASRISRDSAVTVADGFYLSSGEFAPSGGSARYPKVIGNYEDEAKIMRGSIPVAIYDSLDQSDKDKITLLSEVTHQTYVVELPIALANLVLESGKDLSTAITELLEGKYKEVQSGVHIISGVGREGRFGPQHRPG